MLYAVNEERYRVRLKMISGFDAGVVADYRPYRSLATIDFVIVELCGCWVFS
ncbi:hypothetical protein M405DRAFT_805891 [Rhizopogon salebrosus TDB-379]|nr:hypothetical protein M405DRAFT_805891 [Rhizopogon salebrosus TDB-379]